MRHVGNVQQTVDAAKINKRTKVGDVLDQTFADLTDFQFCHQLLLAVCTFFFDQRTTRDNDVTALSINLQHFTLNDATNVIADVAGTADVDL